MNCHGGGKKRRCPLVLQVHFATGFSQRGRKPMRRKKHVVVACLTQGRLERAGPCTLGREPLRREKQQCRPVALWLCSATCFSQRRKKPTRDKNTWSIACLTQARRECAGRTPHVWLGPSMEWTKKPSAILHSGSALPQVSPMEKKKKVTWGEKIRGCSQPGSSMLQACWTLRAWS